MQLTEFRLLVDDFPGCFRFYRDVMGFHPTMGEDDEQYAAFEIGAANVNLAIFKRALMAAAIGATNAADAAGGTDRVTFNLMVDDLDATMRELQGRGAVFVAGPTDQPVWGMRVAHLRDPDGTLIELGQSIPQRE